MQHPPRRAGIYIDGSNLYNRLTESGIRETLRFDYAGLFAHLAQGLHVVHTGYYVGQVEREEGSERSEKLFRNQQRLFSWLRQNVAGITIERGRIVRRGRTHQEKGVDVKLAIDLVAHALLQKIDVAILISSDTDLVPAVQAARMKRVHVRYVGLDAKPSKALVRFAEPVLLTRETLLRFAARPASAAKDAQPRRSSRRARATQQPQQPRRQHAPARRPAQPAPKPQETAQPPAPKKQSEIAKNATRAAGRRRQRRRRR